MLDLGIVSFFFLWLPLIGISYILSGRRVGVCLFFSASTILYLLLPAFFHSEQQYLIGTLFFGALLAIFGFNLGFGLLRLGQDDRDSRLTFEPLDPEILVWAPAILGALSLFSLLSLMPDFLANVQTYEGRIQFQGEYGPLAFLLNQVVVSVSVLTIVFWSSGRKMLAYLFFFSLIAWAFYSNAKLSMLTAFAAYFSVLVTKCRFFERSEKRAFAGFVLMPLILPIMVLYSVYRGAESNDPAYLLVLFSDQIQNIGRHDLAVGDFDGPFQVVASLIERGRESYLLGETYISQLKILLPRAMRGGFLDLTEEYAVIELGSTVKAGVGFAYSTWAEAYMNFGFSGFFIQAFLAGLISRGMWQWCVEVFGRNELPLFFQFVLLAYLQRTYLIGHVKGFIVMVLPLIVVTLIARPFLLQQRKRKRLLAAAMEGRHAASTNEV